MKSGNNTVVSEGEVLVNITDGPQQMTTADGDCLFYKLHCSLWLRWAKTFVNNFLDLTTNV